MASEKFTGRGKLFNPDGTFRTWKAVRDGAGHLGIALGAALLVVSIPATLRRWGARRSAAVGAAVGFAAMALREGIQWAASGSFHWMDRAVDMAPAIPGGVLGGLAAWWLSKRVLDWFERRRKPAKRTLKPR